MILTWQRVSHTATRTVYASRPDGAYTLTGTLTDPSHAGKVGVPRSWEIALGGKFVATGKSLIEAKTLAQRNADKASGGVAKLQPVSGASLTRRIADAIEEAYAGRSTGHIGDHAAEIAALVVGVIAEPWPGADVSKCTHGADCEVHPDVNRLHNFDATAADVLGAVRAAVLIRHKFDEDDVAEIGRRYGVDVRH